jgi:hypothetical protein
MNAMVNVIGKHLAERVREIRLSRATGNWQDASLGDAELFEAAMVLSLSEQTGVVTQEELDVLSKSLFRPFFQELADIEVKEVVSVLTSRFQRFQTNIEWALRGKGLFPERVYVSDARKFAQYANDCLLMYCSIVQDEGFRNYYRIIETAGDEQWSEIIADQPTPARVIAVFEHPIDKSGCLYYGFLRLLGYCSQLRDVTMAISKDPEIDQASATYFNDRLREAFNWRVMMPSYESSRRVDWVKGNLSRLISESEGEGGFLAREFDAAIEDAFGMWRQSASASA